MKHRTQILLEDWQYQTLREMSRKMGTNLSALIRKWVTEKVRKRGKSDRKGLLAFAGVIKNEKAGLTNSEMDQIIYRKDWK